MTLTRASLGNPVAVVVAILLTVLFGLVSLFNLPVQLVPEIQQPQISIATSWRAAAPNEVEAEIIEPQEDVLRGLPGMTELLSQAEDGQGEISLTFSVDMPMDRALVEVINRLNQVPEYPDDADEPIISTVGSDERPIGWFTATALPGNEQPIDTYREFLEDTVQTRFERVLGVARSELIGGRDREIRVTFDPYRVAAYGIQIPIVSRLAAVGKDVSGGGADVGKREYSLRFAGKYNVGDLGGLVLEWRDGHPIYLRDVAEVSYAFVDKNTFVLSSGVPSIVMNAMRETGINVLDVMDGLKAAVEELNAGPISRAGLVLDQVYDETVYIKDSIGMLANNLGLGMLLAVVVLWWFFRRLRPTAIVATAVPICLLSSFLVLFLTGRTVNIISLAGLAFAIGLVMDASIVVLENIVRLRERGNSPFDAAMKGVDQIWGALVASTATTVAIFLPIIFLKEEVGQIFGDLALTISATVCVSLVVAVTVVPTFASKVLAYQARDPHAHWWTGITGTIMALTDTPRRRATAIGLLIVIPVILAVTLLPKADYLPEGERNFAVAFILPPPGANIDQLENEIALEVRDALAPYLNGEKEPAMKRYFFVAGSFGVFMGTEAENREDVDRLVPALYQTIATIPDTIGFAQRVALFGNFGEGRTVDMDIQSRDLERLVQAAGQGFGLISREIPGANVRPIPGLELAKPELRLIPNERRIAEAGWDRGTVAQIMRALGDGLFVGDYFDGNKTVDIVVRGEAWETPEQLAAMPLVTPNAGTLPFSELAEITRTAGPEQIRRINRRRTVTLRVQPPDNVSLSETIELLQQKVEPVVLAALPEDASIEYGGTADKLGVALESMQSSFLLAIAILYLLISALFRSFKDSLLVLLAIPLATVGGVIMLRLINVVPSLLFGQPVFQPMDLLTMIGFVILLGIVVNNAILLVHQARSAEREGLDRRAAVEQAVSLRLRPILMSTLTTIFGMLPLLLVPGAGTELYRGLAGVIVGGMAISTVFTLILLPSLLRLGEERPLRA